jgi:hypothetical protein
MRPPRLRCSGGGAAACRRRGGRGRVAGLRRRGRALERQVQVAAEGGLDRCQLLVGRGAAPKGPGDFFEAGVEAGVGQRRGRA